MSSCSSAAGRFSSRAGPGFGGREDDFEAIVDAEPAKVSEQARVPIATQAAKDRRAQGVERFLRAIDRWKTIASMNASTRQRVEPDAGLVEKTATRGGERRGSPSRPRHECVR
jgi:hypothetical protein